METPLEENVQISDLDQNAAFDNMPTEKDWFGLFALACAIAAVVVGLIPVIGNYFRLVLGIVGLGLAIGGIFENRKRSFKSKLSPIAAILNLAVLIWVCISLTIIGTIIMGVVSNLG